MKIHDCPRSPIHPHHEDGARARTPQARATLSLVTWPLAVVVGLLLVLSVYASPALANTCAWAPDPAPWFPPGVKAVEDQGETKETCNVGRTACGEWVTHTYSQRSWAVYLHPGYVYSHLMAMEEAEWDFVGIGYGFETTTTLDKSYARTAFYFVQNVTKCLNQRPETRTRGSAKLTCYVRENHAEAHMAGLTVVKATRTGMTFTATAGAEIGMSESERQGSLKFTLGLQPSAVLSVPLRYTDSQSYDEDQGSAGGCGAGKVNDEEWVVTIHTDGRCYADGIAVQLWSDARAILHSHYLWMHTVCQCFACGRGISTQRVIDASNHPEIEEMEWTPQVSDVGGKSDA